MNNAYFYYKNTNNKQKTIIQNDSFSTMETELGLNNLRNTSKKSFTTVENSNKTPTKYQRKKYNTQFVTKKVANCDIFERQLKLNEIEENEEYFEDGYYKGHQLNEFVETNNQRNILNVRFVEIQSIFKQFIK